MKKLLNAAVLCLALASGAGALEVTGTVPGSVKGAAKGDFLLSGLEVRGVSFEKGAVVMPVTENKGRTYADVKLLSKALYGKIENCFKNGCAKQAAPAAGTEGKEKPAPREEKQAAKVSVPVIKVEEFKPLKSKIRVANAEVSFDGELLVSLGVMASSKEPGTFWIAFPDTLEFKDGALKAAVEKAVKDGWEKSKK